MSRIDDLTMELCPKGVPFKTLGDIAVLVRGNGMPKTNLTDVGVGAIHYGQIYTRYDTWTTRTISFVTPETASKLAKVQPSDIIITNTSENIEDVGKAVAWLGDETIVTGGHATVIKHNQDPKYLSYWFQSESFFAQKKVLATGTKVIDVSAKQLLKICVPVPPLKVQQKIVRILDQFSSLETELETELDAELKIRRVQYEHYRSILTTSVNGKSQTLDELFDMRSGKFIAASSISNIQSETHMYPCYGGNGIRGYVTTYNQDGHLVLIGRQGALSGNTKRVSGKFYATEHAVIVTPRDASTDVDWAFFKLTSMNLNQYVSKGAQPGLAVGTLKAIKVQVPSVAEQSHVARILRSLHTIVNELSIGIPAELAARRKQYEYYRNRLLSFEEETV